MPLPLQTTSRQSQVCLWQFETWGWVFKVTHLTSFDKTGVVWTHWFCLCWEERSLSFKTSFPQLNAVVGAQCHWVILLLQTQGACLGGWGKEGRISTVYILKVNVEKWLPVWPSVLPTSQWAEAHTQFRPIRSWSGLLKALNPTAN